MAEDKKPETIRFNRMHGVIFAGIADKLTSGDGKKVKEGMDYLLTNIRKSPDSWEHKTARKILSTLLRQGLIPPEFTRESNTLLHPGISAKLTETLKRFRSRTRGK